MDNIKSGHKTTEGAGALLFAAVGLLMTCDVMSNEEGAAWMAVITAFIALAPTLAYIASRTSIKNAAAGYPVWKQVIGDLDSVEYTETD